MEKKLRPSVKSAWLIVFIAAGLQAIGLLYYLFARAPELRPFQTGVSYHYDAHWMSFVGGSLPSFVHAISLFLVIAVFFRMKSATNKTQLIVWVAAIAALLTVECTMGTTAIADVFMIFLALPSALLILSHIDYIKPVNDVWGRKQLSGSVAVVLSAYSLLATASYAGGDYSECARFDDDGRCVERIQTASPIYMSYNVLRSSIRVSEARPMDDVGRIYIFQDTLYVNERNRGIHVIDNSDPFDPQPLRFIEIPGNLDIEIRGSRLYADSFIDLVTLDISNPDTVQEVDRQIDVFAWDENQNIPYNVRLINSEIDRSLGVVIAYEVNQL